MRGSRVRYRCTIHSPCLTPAATTDNPIKPDLSSSFWGELGKACPKTPNPKTPMLTLPPSLCHGYVTMSCHKGSQCNHGFNKAPFPPPPATGSDRGLATPIQRNAS